jgi:4-hydroxy 2-oxovalerate aldolase
VGRRPPRRAGRPVDEPLLLDRIGGRSFNRKLACASSRSARTSTKEHHMYRPEITVVDCTIRDGGLMNKSHFRDETVRNVYRAICASGVQICELGYRNSRDMFSPEEYGAWRFCSEDDLRRVTDGIETDTKLSVMMDAHKSALEDLLPRADSVVDVVRVATYVKDVDRAIRIVNDAADKGYETAINIMSISTTIERELDEALQQIEEETRVVACYIVDSYGALYSEDIDFYVEKFKTFIKTAEVGVHCHNNQQLAYANTIEGIIKGANYLDGTLYGLGRAAGNCPLELLVGFLKNPRFDLRPLFEVIEAEILPLQKEIQWGYHVPYMIAGRLNMHPELSMQFLEESGGGGFRAFYEKCLKLQQT